MGAKTMVAPLGSSALSVPAESTTPAHPAGIILDLERSAANGCQTFVVDAKAHAAGHFSSTYLRIVNSVPIAVIGLICLSTVTAGTGGAIFGLSAAGVSGYLAFRGSTMGISYSQQGVTARGFLRTRRWPWSEVRDFSVQIGSVGAMTYRRKILLITLRNGERIGLRDQNASPKDTGKGSWIEEAADKLNQELNRNI
jgi:PH (Pleckstrin Homology) domain-containing protein